MATNRSFSEMINDYLTTDILRAELPNRMYLLDKVKKDNSWVGGNGTQGYVVPFVGGQASTVKFGELSASDDIAEDTDIRGTVTVQPELWGSMKFNSKDFMQHEGKKREISLLRSVKRQIDPFMTFIKTGLSDVLLSGPHFATVTALTDAANGVVAIDRIEKTTLKQKIIFREAATPSAVAGYVQAINKSAGTVTVHTTRAGGVPLDLTVAGPLTAALLVGDKLYYDGLVSTTTGAIQNNFSSLRGTLLSAANGGSATLYGQTKTAYPFLQALNIDGSAGGAGITSANILENLFEIYATEIDVKSRELNGKKCANYLLSPKNYAAAKIALEKYKGQYYTVPGDSKAKVYAWSEITIGGKGGDEITLTKVPELSDDIIPCVNWDSFVLASNGFFRFPEHPEKPGSMHYYEERATSGYTYIVDICFMGDLINICPESNSIIYGVSI